MEQKLKVKLSWTKYWEKFKEEHGEPVEYNGRCLFADGWMYALSDPAGPEFPPPQDDKERLKLRIRYTQIRLAMVTAEYNMLKKEISNLELLQQRFSLPLQQQIITNNEGTQSVEYVALDIRPLKEGRLQWLEHDIDICKEDLKILQQTLKSIGG